MNVIRHYNEWWWGRTYTLITADGMAMVELAIDVRDGRGDYGTIQSLMVHESRRRQGIADALIIKCEELAQELGLEQTVLNALKNSWRIEWYRRLGYEIYDDTAEEGHVVSMQKFLETKKSELWR